MLKHFGKNACNLWSRSISVSDYDRNLDRTLPKVISFTARMAGESLDRVSGEVSMGGFVCRLGG